MMIMQSKSTRITLCYDYRMFLKMLESLLVGASIAAIPGPIFFELVRRTLTKGLSEGITLVIGEFTGNFILLLLIFFGASQFLTNHAARVLFFTLGGCILLWVSIGAFRLQLSDVTKSYNENVEHKNKSSYLTGLIVAVTSPIVIALWVSLSSSYLNILHNHVLAFINIFLIALGFLLFFIPAAYFVHKTRHRIPPDKVVLLSKIFGSVLVLYALLLFGQTINHL